MRRAVAIAGLATTLVACASSTPSGGGPPSPSPGAGSIVVQGTWASAAGPRSALVYFLVSNPSGRPDVLRGASSKVGGRAILEKATSAGSMQPVDRVTVAAGGQVAFQPGSYQVALVGLDRAPRSGTVVRLELDFRRAGQVEVSAGVR
jgi:periplasmic copper chaperone A